MKFGQFLLAVASVAASAQAAPSASPKSHCPGDPVSDTKQHSIFDEFARRLLIEKDPIGTVQRHVSEDYIQHNPSVLSGRQAAVDVFESFPSPQINYTVISTGFACGRAWIHYRMDILGSLPSAVVDLYRFEGSCIVEHWDVMEEKPANATNPLALW